MVGWSGGGLGVVKVWGGVKGWGGRDLGLGW